MKGRVPLTKSNTIINKTHKPVATGKKIETKKITKLQQENVIQGPKVEEKLVSIPVKTRAKKNVKVDYKIPEITTPETELNLLPCKDCGRSFVKEALQRHQKICKKIFINKRKEFNSAKQRF